MRRCVCEVLTATWLGAVVTAMLLVPGIVAQVPHPAPAVQSRRVLVSSDPPGAAIWLKEGKESTCTGKVTPASIELVFRGPNDFKQLLVTRFGYKRQKVLVKATEEKVSPKLTPWGAPFFTPPEDAPPEIKKLNANVSKLMNETIPADGGAFQCTAVDFRQIDVRKIKGSDRLALYVLVEVNPIRFRRLRAGSQRGDKDREKKFGQAALEEGAGEIFGRFRAVAVRFPAIADVVVDTVYSANKAVTTLEDRAVQFTTTRPVSSTRVFGNRIDGTWGQTGVEVKTETTQTVQHWDELVVKDEDSVGRVFLSMPVGKIPASQDKKAIIDAVLANAIIQVSGQ